MLKRGFSDLIRLFSSSNASASEPTVVVSISTTRATIWAMRGLASVLRKYERTRLLRSRALPTYSTVPEASFIR